MQQDAYEVVFSGQVLNGWELKQVRKKAQEIFKVPEQKLEQLFSGKPIKIKKNISKQQAEQVMYRLKSVGLDVSMQTAGTAQSAVSPRPESQPAPSINSGSYDEAETREDAQVSSTTSKWNAVRDLVSLRNTLLLSLALIAVVMVVGFSPFPDGVVRKGFGVGIVLLLFSINRLRA